MKINIQVVGILSCIVLGQMASGQSGTTFQPIRVNCGGATYTDGQGRVWSADTGFAGGSTFIVANTISNTSDQPLYNSQRFGAFQYQFTVPNGYYFVALKFSENYYTTPGSRVWKAIINGRTVLSSIDAVAQSGAPFRAIDKKIPVYVTGGTILIQFGAIVDLPTLDALEITAAAPDEKIDMFRPTSPTQVVNLSEYPFVEKVKIFRNGVLLASPDDYTLVDGQQVNLVSAQTLQAGDIMQGIYPR